MDMVQNDEFTEYCEVHGNMFIEVILLIQWVISHKSQLGRFNHLCIVFLFHRDVFGKINQDEDGKHEEWRLCDCVTQF